MRHATRSPPARLEHRPARHPALGLLVPYLVVGGRPVVMTRDDVASWARGLEFLDVRAHRGVAFPLACALRSAAGQLLGGFALMPGLWTRMAALIVAVSSAVAKATEAAKSPYLAAVPVLALLAGTLCLAFTGAGRLSLDALLRAWP